MAMKEQPKQIYRTARGAEIDMGKLINQNEMTVAVGNARVNARGDKLGPDGKIIMKREEILAQNSGPIIPNQINIRPEEPVTPTAPTTVDASTKDVTDMDPEGNE
jgi:hypothetical protein